MNWRVYRVEKCPGVTPIKAKYLVVFDFEVDIRGFLINSRLHGILKKNHMKPCVAAISSDSNDFLHHNSFIDCSKLIRLEVHHLYDLKGSVCEQTRSNIIKAVTACPVLSLSEKKVILGKV